MLEEDLLGEKERLDWGEVVIYYLAVRDVLHDEDDTRIRLRMK